MFMSNNVLKRNEFGVFALVVVSKDSLYWGSHSSCLSNVLMMI